MTGLEKIQEKILDQSKADCDVIISKANQKAKEILINARMRAEELSAKIISDAEELSEIFQLAMWYLSRIFSDIGVLLAIFVISKILFMEVYI